MSIIYSIPESHAVIIERFGKFARVQKQGLRFKWPFIEKKKRLTSWAKTANKGQYLIELSEQQSDTAPRQCQSKDNVTIEADAVIYWRIVDPRKAVYEIDILPKSIRDSALNSLRANIGKLDFDEILSQRQELNDTICKDLLSATINWGIEIYRTEIQEINYSTDIEQAMTQEMAAERKRRAVVAEAEGEATSELRVAEARAKAILLTAEAEAKALALRAAAEAEYLSQIGKSSSSSSAAKILIAQKLLEGYKEISKNPGDKVFIPNNFTGVANLNMD